MNIDQLHDGHILRGDRVDATANRERVRRKRLWWAVVLLGAREARANAPEFVAALTGKAADQWQAACATATTTPG